MADSNSYDLTLVMPVYNEGACIEAVVSSWHKTLKDLDINFHMLVLNDGSQDNTAECLGKLSRFPEIQIINKANSGHGSTILMGYRTAVGNADWVFQVDSDDEMSPLYFHLLWDNRADYDALFGIRTNREQSFGRKLISVISRKTISVLYGRAVEDVNVPYRLMRANILAKIVTQIPEDTFAPNIIISGALIAAKSRIFNCPILHETRKTGTVSIVKWKLWKAAIRSFWQTIRCRPRI